MFSVFLSRSLPGQLGSLINDRGHELRVLSGKLADGDVFDWKADAQLTADTLCEFRANWLVVDHYSIDAGWERAVRPAGCKVLVIDDLVDRLHDCDVLLDQNLGRSGSEYQMLVPVECSLLAGPRFALLRPQFSEQRPNSLRDRRDRPFEHLLVAMGGTDGSNATEAILDALKELPLPSKFRVTVVLGSGAPWLEKVRAVAATMPWPVSVEADVKDMAGLLAGADIAVGAGGGSALERCCLGLPSLLLIIADNQNYPAAALDKSGAAILLGDLRKDGWRQKLAEALVELSRPAERLAMSETASGLADGCGADRVVRAMLGLDLTVRAATLEDAEAIWRWRHAGDAVRFYADPRPTPLAEHMTWFVRALHDCRRLLLVVSGPSGPFAHVRFDRKTEAAGEAEVAICLAETARGKGLSSVALEKAIEYAVSSGVHHFTAIVHEDNIGSIKLFSALDFAEDGKEGPFVKFSRAPMAAEEETGN